MDRQSALRFLLKSVVYRVIASVVEVGFFFVWFGSWQTASLLALPVVVLNFIRIGGYWLFDIAWARTTGAPRDK